jgi:DNA-binding FadR family transcriptional regulator
MRDGRLASYGGASTGMAEVRTEPFRVALGALRDRLRTGQLRPGERLAATVLAEALQLSATPVREALARLAGEGLIEERRGQGYFVRALSADDVADLYRLSLAHLVLALKPERTLSASTLEEAPTPFATAATDAVAAVEQLMQGWVRAAGGRALTASYARISLQLGPVRRREPLLFKDLADEADRLLTLRSAAQAWLPAVRRFHGRRVAAAPRLAGLLDREFGGEL